MATIWQEYGYLKRKFPVLKDVPLIITSKNAKYKSKDCVYVGLYDYDSRSIILNPKFIKIKNPSVYSILILLHEVRHAIQDSINLQCEDEIAEIEADRWAIGMFMIHYTPRYNKKLTSSIKKFLKNVIKSKIYSKEYIDCVLKWAYGQHKVCWSEKTLKINKILVNK